MPRAGSNTGCTVMTALTPKGVEHMVLSVPIQELGVVMTALTPKGVEHALLKD